jgi:nitrogen fixation protein NifB
MSIVTEVERSFDCHPCFNSGVRHRYGRIHLPVAPSCNIQCAYCNRNYACVNENRPGVTRALLEPQGALEHLERTLRVMPFIKVVGIAGPGDPLCDEQRTMETLELVRRAHPKLHLCLSSNGLNMREHLPDLAVLGVRFVTVTVNAVDPEIGAKMIEGVRWQGEVLMGLQGAQRLLENQIHALEALKNRGMMVKVNTVVVPGVNDGHVITIASRMARRGVNLMNVIGVIPVAGTPLGGIAPPSARMLARLRTAAEVFVPQMRHCARCRSDAAGLLHGQPLHTVPV